MKAKSANRSHQNLAVITIPCGPGCSSTKPMFMVMLPLPWLMVD
jgi:hypothetical protein